jgi:hypothetical protein
MEPEELIKRYAHEVSRHLPRKQRADVETELNTLLHDMMEERAEASGRPIDEALAVDVVRVFGEPSQVAQRYLPPNQYLIGPAYYPTFVTIMKLLVGILVGVYLLLTALSIFSPNGPFPTLGSVLWGFGSWIVTTIWTSLGAVVFFFALMERFAWKFAPTGQPWDPMDLPEIQDPDQLDKVELLSAVILGSVALLMFNLYPNWIDYLVIHDGVWGGMRIFSPEFFVHLPWFNVSWLLEIGLALIVLRAGRWNRVTRALKIGTTLFSGVIMYRLITGGAIIDIPMIDSVVKGGLMVALLVLGIVTVGQVYQLITGNSLMPIQTLKPPQLGNGSPSVK